MLHAGEKLRERGVDVDFLPVNGQGVVAPEDVQHALRPNTRLISIMMANNETGVLQPVNEIGQIAAEAGVRFHVDAVQAAGKLPLEMDAIGCHLLTISGHKMHAPQGTGALFVRRGTRLEPLFAGGAHERQRRAGTENVAGIVGLGKAAECAMEGLRNGAPERMGRPAGPVGVRSAGADNRNRRKQRGRSPGAEYDQPLVRPPGRRGAGDRAGPQGSGGVEWRSVFFRRQRTLPRAPGNGSLARAGAQQPALEPAPADNRRRD